MMRPRPFHSRSPLSAFTLVEMIVSIAVLSLLMVALSTLTSFVIKSWLNGINTVDNFTKARSMLNLLDRDVQLMVMRRDLGAFVDQGGNPACAFYASVQGYPGTDNRTLALVCYTNNLSSSSAVLQRLNYGMNFVTNGVSPTFGTANIGSLSQLGNVSANGTQEILSTGVIAFKWQFIDGNGYIQTPPSSAAFNYNFVSPGSGTNYRALIISMVVMSNNAYNLALKTGNLSRVQNDFPLSLPANTNQSFATYWSGLLNSPAGGTFDSSLPAPIRGPGGIQVFERHIPLPVTATSF